MTEQEYWQSIEDYCDMCEDALKDNFVSFIVIGSLGAGDIVPGWSDVDSFLIVRDDSDKVVEQRNMITKAICQKYPYYQTDRGSWFCAMVTTKEYFLTREKATNPLNLWDVKHYGKFIRGDNFIQNIVLPELDKSWPGENIVWMSDYLKRDKDASPFWQLRNSVGFILCGARNMLLKNGMYLKRYGDILAEFSKLYPEKSVMVKEAHDYRKNWADWQHRTIDVARFYGDALEFLDWCLVTE